MGSSTQFCPLKTPSSSSGMHKSVFSGIIPGMETNEKIIAQTSRWIERVVIGLNLCPFARTPVQQGLVRYVVSETNDANILLQEFEREIILLQNTPATEIETTVLIHPYVMQNFLDYNDFLDPIDALLDEIDPDQDFQVASLHPKYQFAGTAINDAENYTNRSPYPLLHLLREESVSRATESYLSPERIPERNIRIMNKHGADQMKRWLDECMQEPTDG